MFQSSLSDILYSDSTSMVSFTGAGGKTSLLFLLAHELVKKGLRVLTTTTTKICPPDSAQSPTVILQTETPDFSTAISRAIDQHRHVTVARSLLRNTGKLQGLSPETITELFKQNLADIWLVEADGAARKPLKAPAKHEPVIPLETGLVVGVMGADAIDAPLTPENVFRPERVAALTGLAPGDKVSPRALVQLAVHPDGLFKNTPGAAKRCLLVNKADSPASRKAAREVIDEGARMEPQRIRWIYGSVFQNTFYEKECSEQQEGSVTVTHS